MRSSMLRMLSIGLIFSFAVATLSIRLAASQTPDATGNLGARVKTLEDQIKALQAGSGVPTPQGIAGGQADDAGTVSCPPGSYVAGVRAWKSSPATKYCIGCLTGIQLICKPFIGP